MQHGHSTRTKVSRTYVIWKDMISRCANRNGTYYHLYGGRGITVCKKWKDFKNFLKDMGEVPKGYQIDRINNDGNYCKSNCRWVTPKQNSRNTRKNRLITFNGETRCLAAWAEKIGINTNTLHARIGRLNWPIKKALTTPVKKRRR